MLTFPLKSWITNWSETYCNAKFEISYNGEVLKHSEGVLHDIFWFLHQVQLDAYTDITFKINDLKNIILSV